MFHHGEEMRARLDRVCSVFTDERFDIPENINDKL